MGLSVAGSVLVVLMALGAYGSPQDSSQIVSVSSEPGAGLTHGLEVTLDSPAWLTVEYGSAGVERLRVVREGPVSTHSVTLARLRAETEYRWLARTAGDSATGTFTTPPLPVGLRDITFRGDGNPSAPLVLLEPSHPSGFSGPVVLDREGAVVWYSRTEGDIHGAIQRSTGSFVFLDVQRGLVEMDPNGQVFARLETSDERRIHHDVIETSGGEILFLAREWRSVAGDSVRGEAVWRWDPTTGETVQIWSAFDHLSFEQDRGPRSRARNWLHANSLAEGPRGNLVLGLSFLSQVISVAADGSGVEWRLGGPNATIHVDRDPFVGQHTSAEIASGRMLLFDNRLAIGSEDTSPGGDSRALELEVSGDSAIQVWSFRAPNRNRSGVVGSAHRLANGNTLVNFGAMEGLRGSTGPIEVYEVTSSGEVVWRMEVGGPIRTLYRVTPLETIAGERPVTMPRSRDLEPSPPRSP